MIVFETSTPDLGGGLRADQVTHKRAGRGSEGGNRHEEEHGGAAHDVGHCQWAFTEVFHGNKEQKPSGHGQKGLDHGPNGDVEYARQ